MPIHDWSRVDPCIFHAFHHSWITEIARALNQGFLPTQFYALVEQPGIAVDPDVLVPESPIINRLQLAAPKLKPTAEADLAFYRRKQNAIAVRHVSGDSLVAMIEIVSPGNKSSRSALRTFVEKAADLLEKQIHLLIIDLHPPGPRDPHGIHGEIWDEAAGDVYTPPADKPLTLASYECGLVLRAYVVPVAVGDVLTDMPLFLEPEKAVELPLEATYLAAFAAMPGRWQRVLE